MADTSPKILQPQEHILGLVLGGGAALGWAHIGALRELDAAGIEPDVVAGTSIGALVGACWMVGALDALEQTAREMSWRRMLGYADPQLGAPGIFKGEAVVAELAVHLRGRRIEDLPKRYAAVAADLISGKEVRLTEGPIEEAVRASISVPGVFTPVEREGGLLVDGGLVDPVPVAAARALGADTIIALDVTGDYHGRARAAGLYVGHEFASVEEESANGQAQNSGWLDGIAARIFKRGERRPGLYAVGTTSAALIMRELAKAKLQLNPPDWHICPEVGHFSPVEFDKAEALIAAGRDAMRAYLPAIQQTVAKKSKKSAV